MAAGSPGAKRIDERLGRSLRRRPWVWLTSTLVLIAIVWSAGATAFATEHRAWPDWLTVGFVAYGLLAVTVLVPRVVAPHSRQKISEDRLALLQWSFALAPFVVGFVGLALGGHSWSITIAFIATAVLLAYTALTAREGERSTTS